MAKIQKTYKVNSTEIVIAENFATVSEAKEAIRKAAKGIDTNTDRQLGTIEGFAKEIQMNTTPFRMETGKIAFGRTTKTDEAKKIDAAKANEKAAKVTEKEEVANEIEPDATEEAVSEN